ncbi:hypothetical protein [Candidatus Methanomethylophilus sp. 1R26]|uniref:hypothetical protein n=1 Tax=Candidatus Methanomethylophilus sp. 1R26 TaxID=1769296 RepID=UPI0012FF56EB|nr:hypothetical protein [Candidatus Methanomethylophilus sp. 1R26]
MNASTGSIGIAFNGDGTRLALLDESGKFVPGDKLLAIMLLAVKPSKAVVPYASPSIVDDAFYRYRPRGKNGGGLIRHGNSLESIMRPRRTAGPISPAPWTASSCSRRGPSARTRWPPRPRSPSSRGPGA